MKALSNIIRFIAIVLAIFLIIMPIWTLSGDLSEVADSTCNAELAKMMIGIFVVSPLWVVSSILRKIAERRDD